MIAVEPRDLRRLRCVERVQRISLAVLGERRVQRSNEPARCADGELQRALLNLS